MSLLCKSAFIALILALNFALAATAGPNEHNSSTSYDDGVAAYNKRDYSTALRIFQALAVKGVAPAQNNLGVLYEVGQGVSQNYAEAARWFRLAAEQGIAVAQLNLGILYAKGQGVPQDYVLAHMWFNLAAAQGDKLAEKNKDRAARLMTMAQIVKAQKLAREWKPIKHGLDHPDTFEARWYFSN
jgi:uncharacterized protein